MATPIKKEFGPGYDYPNRKFHFWAVILPTVLVAALAVVLMRHTDSASNRVTRSPIVACPTQTCRPAGVADSAKPSQPASAGVEFSEFQLDSRRDESVLEPVIVRSDRCGSSL